MKYIDISEHQGITTDWEKVNVDGVMIRAGYGKTQDKYWQLNVNECNRLKIPCGAYWFCYAKNVDEARDEAKRLLSAVSKYRIELPLAYDLEYDSTSNMKRFGIKPVASLCTEMVNAFCEEIENAGYYAMYYANPDFLNSLIKVTKYDLWLAQWPSGKFDVKYPPRKCGIWQWGTSKVDGFIAPVDTNESYHDYPKMIRAANLNHLDDPKPVDPIERALVWAKNIGLKIDDPTSPATIADIVWLCYELNNNERNDDNASVQ